MSPESAILPESHQDEISTLLEVVRKAGQRLEELTAGQVDTASDPEGRVLLLRGTQAQLNRGDVIRQAAILNALPANIALLDPDGVIISVNDGWTGFASAHAITPGFSAGCGVNYLEVCDEAVGPGADAARRAAGGIRSVLDGTADNFTLDYQCYAPDEKRWFTLTVTPLSDARPKKVIVSHRNITAFKDSEAKLLLLTERLSLATEVGKVAVWEWDVTTNDLKWDATMFAIYGLPVTPVLAYQEWASLVHPDDLSGVEATLRRALDTGNPESAEFRIITPDGSIKHIFAAERVVFDEGGTARRVIGVNMDVTERKKMDSDLLMNQTLMTHLAEHDFLTDLPNQMVLHDRVDQAIKLAARNQEKVALLFLDMDGFKHINDSLGHPIGDKLLQSVASRLVDCVRASDTVSRLGGDEFIILLPEVNHPEGTARAAKRLLEAVARIHSIDAHELHVGACIGVSVFPDDGVDTHTLIKNADTAMYQAKSKGNSNFLFFHADMNLQAMERQFIEQNLRRALERNELTLNYQPKFDLKTRLITGSEALLRWTHPVRGPISPADFIPIAEDCGLIVSIGMWVLQEACRQSAAWIAAGLAAGSVAVNVSGRQFQGDGFEEAVLAVLEQLSMDPKYLELEVTESLLMKSPALAASLLQSLRASGINVAIDDFGTGYSSLSYLQRFPIDTLKIDKSFVQQIGTPNGLSIVTAIIQMGRSLGMKIVAEGVETAEEATVLENLGCEEAQGYYLGRPLTAEAFAELLKQRRQPTLTALSPLIAVELTPSSKAALAGPTMGCAEAGEMLQ